MKRKHPALANGPYGGTLQWLETGNPAIVGFRREQAASRVDVYVNLTAQAQGGRGRNLAAWGYSLQTA